MQAVIKLGISLFFALIIFLLLVPIFPTSKVSLLNIITPFIPYLLIFQVPLLVLFIFKKKRTLSLLVVLTLGFSMPVFGKFFAIDFSGSKNEEGHLKVLSYNVSFMKVPKVFKSEYLSKEYDHMVLKIRTWIIDHDPDLILLQEFFNDRNSEIYHSIEEFSKKGYSHYNYSKTRHDNGLEKGVVIFSKYPIVRKGLITTSANNYNASIFCDIAMGEDTIRVINTHLKSIAYNGKSSNSKDKVVGFVRRYSSASSERALQMDQILHCLDTTRIPVIVGGDFNETPFSNTFRKINSRLRNAHQKRGVSLGNTFPFKSISMGVRIDHLFSSAEFGINSFEVFDEVDYSEHYPIMASYTMNTSE